MMTDANELKAAGNAALSRGDNHEAIKCYSSAIQADGTNHVFYSNRSAAYAALGEYTEALSDAQKCIELNPSFSKGYSRAALCLYNLGRHEEAKEAYESGLKIDPSNQGMIDGLKQVQEILEGAPPAGSNPFGQIFGPDIWVKIKLNPKLAPFLEDPKFVANVQMLQQNPSLISGMLSDPKIQVLFGVLLGMGDQGFSPVPEDGESAFEREEAPPAPKQSKPEKAPEPVVELSGPEKEALTEKNAGNAAYKSRDFKSAISHYEKAIELTPNNPVLLSNIAAVHLETGNFTDAVAKCKECIEKCREHGGMLDVTAKAYGRMGTAYQKAGDLTSAIDSYEHSLMENSDRAIERKLRDAKVLKAKLETEAYLDDGKALEAKERGNALFQEGKWIPAIGEYTESIKRNPKDHRIYSNRAACYTKLMDWGNALNDVNKAIEIDPTFVKAYIRKGKIEMFLKQYHKARETYLAGLKLDPSSSDLQEGISDVEMAIHNENASGDIDPERQARAMEDPEVQRILQDPQVQSVLQQIQSDPALAQKAFNDPQIRKKLDVLIAAGVLRVK